MNRAIAALHGTFGRACLYRMNRNMALHAHREAHLIFHLGGGVPSVRISGCRGRASADVALAVSPLEPHRIDFAAGAAPSTLLVLYIKPDWFQRAAPAVAHAGEPAPGSGTDSPSTDVPGQPPVQEQSLCFGCHHIPVDAALLRLVHNVTHLMGQGHCQDRFDRALHNLTRACFEASWQGQIARKQGNAGRRSAISIDHRVVRSVELMRLQMGSPVVLQRIASQAGLSRPHFFRLFHEQMGVTPNVFVNTLRMEWALERLVNTDEAVTSIGLDLGFASQPSFTRFFAANVGIPPTNYRRVALCA